MQHSKRAKSVEGKVFFAAFLIFAAIIIGAVKNAYDDYLRESYSGRSNIAVNSDLLT